MKTILSQPPGRQKVEPGYSKVVLARGSYRHVFSGRQVRCNTENKISVDSDLYVSKLTWHTELCVQDNVIYGWPQNLGPYCPY